MIEDLDEDLISSNTNCLTRVGELVLKDNSFRVSDALLKLVIVNRTLTKEQRIRIHNWKHTQIKNDYYSVFLNSLEDPYADITINGKRPLLPGNEYNRKLAKIMDAKNFISKFDIEENGIRISTFRKTNEE